MNFNTENIIKLKSNHIVVGFVIFCLFSINPSNSYSEVITFAGSGNPGCQDGPAMNAKFNQPVGLTTVGDIENFVVYVADSECHTIRKIYKNRKKLNQWWVETYAGQAGSSGWVDAITIEAKFNKPLDIAKDEKGNLYVADSGNHVIRRIDASTGKVETIAGKHEQPLAVCGETPVSDPCNTTKDVPTGSKPSKPISKDDALFSSPAAIVVDRKGAVYVADYGTCSVRKVENGMVFTMGKDATGNKIPSYVDKCDCNGPFYHPSGIDIDLNGNIYVSDQHRIQKIDAVTEQITSLAGTREEGYYDFKNRSYLFRYPYHLRFNNNNIFVADSKNNIIKKIDSSTPAISVTAGSLLGNGYKDDQNNTRALFDLPKGIEQIGNLLLIGDTENHVIRKIILPSRSTSQTHK